MVCVFLTFRLAKDLFTGCHNGIRTNHDKFFIRMFFLIACALAHHPRLLILDEATGGLDPVARSELRQVDSAYLYVVTSLIEALISKEYGELEQGYGKRSSIDDYRITNRGGKGVKTINITEKTGKLVAIKNVTDENDLMIINKSGITIRLNVADLNVIGRATQGVRLINLEKRNDEIASVCKVLSESEEEQVENPEGQPEGQPDEQA